MPVKSSRPFLIAITVLAVLAGWYWWNHSGHAQWLQWRTQRQATAMIGLVFSPTLPPTLAITGFADGSDTRPSGVSGKIAREDFDRCLLRDKWTEIPIPRELLRPMHLSADTPRDYMTCYSGQLAQGPAKLLWSDYTEDFNLFLDPLPNPVAP